MLAKTAWFAPLWSMEVGETLRLCEALQWVTNVGLDDMDFSLDLKHVVYAVNSNNSNNTNFGSFISHYGIQFSA